MVYFVTPQKEREKFMDRKLLAGLSLGFVVLIALVSLCFCAGATWLYLSGREKFTGSSAAKATLQAKVWATQTAVAAGLSPFAPAPPTNLSPSPTPTPEQKETIPEIPPELKGACLALFFLRWQTQEIITLIERSQKGELPEEEAKREAQAAQARLNTAETDLVNLASAAGLEEAKTKAQEGLGREKNTLNKWLAGNLPLTATRVELKRSLGQIEEASKMAEDKLKNEYGFPSDSLEKEAKEKYS